MLSTHLALSGSLLPVEFCWSECAGRRPRAVALIGEMTDWLAAPMPLQRGEDGVWRLRLQLRPGQWLYKFVVDEEILPDPANPLRAADGLGGWQSVLLLGAGDWAAREQTRYGEIVEIGIYAHSLQRQCRLHLFIPPCHDLRAGQGRREYDLLYLLHGYRTGGNQWISNGMIANFIGNLSAQGLIEPALVVLPGSIQAEEAQEFQSFLGGELYDWLLRHFPVRAGAAHCAVAGMSQFSLSAYSLAAQFPQRFGMCAPVSAFYPQALLQAWQQNPAAMPLPGGALRMYCGLEDYALARNEALAALLQARGVKFSYLRVRGEHSWHYWNGITRDLLLALNAFFSASRPARTEDAKGASGVNSMQAAQAAEAPIYE